VIEFTATPCHLWYPGPDDTVLIMCATPRPKCQAVLDALAAVFTVAHGSRCQACGCGKDDFICVIDTPALVAKKTKKARNSSQESAPAPVAVIAAPAPVKKADAPAAVVATPGLVAEANGPFIHLELW